MSTCRHCHVVFLGPICDDDIYRPLQQCVQQLERLVELLRAEAEGGNQNDLVVTLWIIHGLLSQAVGQLA